MLSLGTLLEDRYRVDRLLEIGALDGQYGGWDLKTNTAVLIKEMMPQPELDDELLMQLQADFERDAAELSHMVHPHIVRVLDYFVNAADDTPVPNAYMILESTAGQTLAELISRQGTIKENRVISWADQLLNALSYVHNRGICHRDIKPENILISPDDRAMLTNFEILALWNRSDPRTWTAKRVMGTPEYAPPERWGMRTALIDPRSDVYSLGATLYHALTGEKPLTAGERTSNPYQFLQVKALSSRVSAQTQAVIFKAMALPQDKRYQTAEEMAEALARPREEGETVGRVQPPAIFLPTQRSQTSWPRILGLATSTLVLIIAGLIGLYLGDRIRPSTVPNTPKPTGSGPVAPVTATPSLGGIAEMPIEATPDVATTAAPTETATPMPGETEAPEPALTTASPSLRPTPPPTWQRVVADSFDDNANQWLVSEYEDDWGTTLREVSDGAYQWTINAGQPVGRWCTLELDGEESSLTDFLVTVEAQRVSGPDAAAYGMVVRQSEGSYYLFSVRDDGYFQFSLWYGYDWQTIIDWTQTLSVKTGEVNRLAVLAQGSDFELYINESLVASPEDEQITTGEVGLSISTAATDGEARFVFDNFNLWRP